jgi:DNA mismatch repair protein MutL
MLAASYPDVHFRLDHAKRTILDAPSVSTRRERLYQLERSWVENAIELREEVGGLAIEAWLAPPAESRGASTRLRLFVNGRPVKDRILHHAVTEAYRQASSRTGTPLVYLFVELPPEKLDVNVHPAKSEVRFAEGQFVHHAVFSVLRNALQGEWKAPEVALVRETPPESPPFGFEAPDGIEIAGALLEDAAPPRAPVFGELSEDPPKPIGQFRRSFIVAVDAESVLLIDQHAAHERILYEDLVDRGAAQMGQQLLLTPAPLELTPAESVAIEEELEELVSFGYDLEPFGSGGYVLRAVPASLAGLDPVRLIRAALGEGERECRSAAVREAESRVAARIACHAAIKVNFELAPEKMQYLVRELWRARQPTVCPHGRPTTLHIGKEQIERGFGRI